MPRKLKKMEDSESLPKSRMESVPGGSPERSERGMSPDMAQMMEDLESVRGESKREETSKVESLRQEIGAGSDLESLRAERAAKQAVVRGIQTKFEADGIGPDVYATEDLSEFMSRARTRTRKNASGWQKFKGSFGAMLTGGAADQEFFDNLIERYNELSNADREVEQLTVKIDTIVKPKRRSSRIPMSISSDGDRAAPMYGHASVPNSGFDLQNFPRDIKESIELEKSGATKKTKRAMKEVSSQTENIALPEEAEAMEMKREEGRKAARQAREAGKIGKRGKTAKEFEESFAIPEESVDVDLSELNEAAAESETPAEVKALEKMSGLFHNIAEYNQSLDLLAEDEKLEQAADVEDKIKSYESQLDQVIEGMLDSTSDAVYERVVDCQNAIKALKETRARVFAGLEQQARTAGKGKRVMGVSRTGSRSSGGSSFGAGAMDRPGMVKSNVEQPEISEPAWQKRMAGYKAAEDKRKLNDDFDSMMAETDNEVNRLANEYKKETTKEAKTKEKRAAKKQGIEVKEVEAITDPFSERQSYYEKNADLMKWSMDNKSFNAADLWERTNLDIEKLSDYDRADISAALGNAPDLAAAYVLEAARIAQGDESGRNKLIRANLVLGRDPEANLGTARPIVSEDMQSDIKKAGKKVQKNGRNKAA